MKEIKLKDPSVVDVIEALKKMPQDAPVHFDDGTGWTIEELIIWFDACDDGCVEILGKC